MQMDGEDLRPLPLTERRGVLQDLPRSKHASTLRLCQRPTVWVWKGVVSKLRDQPYKSGENRGCVTSTSYSRNSEG